MRAWLFPGQGSQRKGMGEGLFDLFPGLCAEVDAILGYSIRDLCLKDPDGRLRQTQYAQPALFVVNALTHLARLREEPEPDFYAGHSLGEFDALFAAGCFDLATGVRLVRRRGELMGRADGGVMTAVLGLPAATVAALLEEAGVADVDVANHNSADQVVLSGAPEGMARAVEAVERAGGARCVPLNVSAAFHSRHMRPAAEEFAAFLREVEFAPPRVPVVANVTARPYPRDGVADLLARQIASPVRWWDSMSYLFHRGVREIAEVGPGTVLTGLWRSACRTPATVTPVPQAPAPVTPAAPMTPAHANPAPTAPAAEADARLASAAEKLGSARFRREYGLRYAYLAGSMYKGISSADLVVRMGRSGLMGFFGAGGLSLERTEQALLDIRRRLGSEVPFGMNLLNDLDDPAREERTVTLYLKHDVRFVEAAAYLGVTAPLVRFRFSGAHRDAQGRPVAVRRVLAKVSRPEVATAFMSPPPQALLDRLVREGGLTPAEAEVARELPVGGEVCVEADSGGHTDAGVALTLVPAMRRLRDELTDRYGYRTPILLGASGGLGAPEAVAAAFVLGADFVLTGSVNQCSPEAGTSEAVKDLLAGLDVQDTAYAPSGDMFELGARVQVVRKGTLFAARATKLHQLYQRHRSLEEIDPATLASIERTFFRRSVEEVWRETRDHYLSGGRPHVVEKAERDPRHRMVLVFKWYFAHSNRLALAGDPAERANYQIHCGPAMGAFNRFVRGSELEDWRDRHVDVIAERLMTGAARCLDGRIPADPTSMKE
ncbi:ACP S-malonyltransferase [Microbispora hainanensis]|jgi:trans-AT polyketide synthase/acyltransferase/oxidoreductase domain-containing protein|uniref:[acyl-carrier-protein] S-malonyltransferase n=1 Tax=Microbispora hainanensis TaxID=568844 RepID=A0ABZ1SZB4_9ACTN|nr:ACP S-malonyltransferase [Microbispora hainanensis]